MIDRASRDQLAEAIRALSSGVITNDQFEDRRFRKSDDPAIFEVFFNGPWHIYDDLHEHKMTGHYHLRPEDKEAIARWVLFLKTDFEYTWPRTNSVAKLIFLVLSVVTLGVSSHVWRSRFRRSGDVSVWPFISRTDYEKALSSPPFLSKTR